MQLTFSGTVFEWRGPAPYLFVATSDDVTDQIADVAAAVTYGWGVIPVTAQVGDTTWTTSLFPKQDTFYLPLKVAVRRAEGIELGQLIDVSLTLDV